MVNRVFLVGRVGKKPELQEGKSGKLYCRFSLATDGIGDRPTNWHDVTCFGKTAENVCKFVDKGSVVSVEGSIQYGEYEKDGVKHRSCGINANAVTFITYPDKSVTQETQANSAKQQEYEYFDDIPIDGTIPF